MLLQRSKQNCWICKIAAIIGLSLIIYLVPFLDFDGGKWGPYGVHFDLGLQQTASSNPNDLNIYVFETFDAPPEMRVAAHMAIGLLNRVAPMGKPVAYGTFRSLFPEGIPDVGREMDSHWINETAHNQLKQTAEAQGGQVVLVNATWEDLIVMAASQGLFKGRISYNHTEKHALQAVVSAGVVNDALPIPINSLNSQKLLDMAMISALPQILEATGKWKDFIEATKYTIEFSIPYSHKSKLALQSTLLLKNGYLVDYLMANKVAVIWMNLICSPFSEDTAVFNTAAQNNPHWDTSQPLSIMGYYPGVFEAISTCTERKSEFAYVGDWVSGWSFMQKFPSVQVGDLQNNKMPEIKYDPEKIYVSVINSDGDNIRFLQYDIAAIYKQRVQLCNEATPRKH